MLPLVQKFSKEFGLVGGTAIALHIGHRESIDFDLFANTAFENTKLRRKILSGGYIPQTLRDETGQYTLIANGVHITFFHYPFPLTFSENFDSIIALPDLLTLGAMKLYALGRRAKWKDYVDMYFILKDHHTLEDIIQKSTEMFQSDFNEKVVREQLSYFTDINYSEEVVFRPGFEVNNETIQKSLTEWALE